MSRTRRTATADKVVPVTEATALTSAARVEFRFARLKSDRSAPLSASATFRMGRGDGEGAFGSGLRKVAVDVPVAVAEAVADAVAVDVPEADVVDVGMLKAVSLAVAEA